MQLNFESDRLRYRPLREDDIDLAITLFTDPKVVRYVCDEVVPEDELIAEMPIVTRRAGDGCIGIWCIEEKSTGMKLGTIFLLPMPIELDDTDWSLVNGGPIPEGPIEIGYIFARKAWGKGYATEAARRVLRFAFEETPLSEIDATTYDENEPSRHVLRKAGLTEIGQIKAYGEHSLGFRARRESWLAAQG